MNTTSHSRVVWITRTGVLTALLIALQWATSFTQPFAGQYITGSCVNAVLCVAALFGGLWSGISVALLSPFFAFALGIGPKLIQIVPGVALGNLVFVVCLYFLLGNRQPSLGGKVLGCAAAALAKFLTLYLTIVRFIVPTIAAGLKPPQIAAFSTMFSWPQLITAGLGCALAMVVLPLLKKAIKA